MALTQEQIAAIARCEQVLASAQSAISLSDWTVHDRARDAILDSTIALFLRTNARTGQLEDGVIWPESKIRVPIGVFASALDPIVTLLEEQTARIRQSDQLAGSPDIPWPERAAWDHWEFERLPAYRAAIKAAMPADPANEQPSRLVWDRVTLPLLQGLYPADFRDKGISDPSVRSVPDVIYTSTVWWQMALVAQTQQQAWFDAMSEAGKQALRVLTFPFFAAGALITGAAQAFADGINKASPDLGRKLGWGLALAVGGVGTLVVLNKKGSK